MGFVEFVRGDHLVEEYTSIVNGTLVIHEDELIKIYPFVNGLSVFLLVASYLSMVVIGPMWMKKRKPFVLRKTLIVYNSIQVTGCLIFLYSAFGSLPLDELLPFLFNNVCRPVGLPYDSFYRVHALHGTAVYFLMKIVDLSDTAFMILRKQNEHITFLHLFHHTSMVLSMWYQLVYVRGELGGLFGLLNIFVHVIMYGYYLMSALGPPFKNIVVPWKRYVTIIQISQFGIVLSVLGVLAWIGCEMPPNMWFMWLFNNILFFVLFLNFFIRSYLMKKKTS